MRGPRAGAPRVPGRGPIAPSCDCWEHSAAPVPPFEAVVVDGAHAPPVAAARRVVALPAQAAVGPGRRCCDAAGRSASAAARGAAWAVRSRETVPNDRVATRVVPAAAGWFAIAGRFAIAARFAAVGRGVDAFVAARPPRPRAERCPAVRRVNGRAVRETARHRDSTGGSPSVRWARNRRCRGIRCANHRPTYPHLRVSV